MMYIYCVDKAFKFEEYIFSLYILHLTCNEHLGVGWITLNWRKSEQVRDNLQHISEHIAIITVFITTCQLSFKVMSLQIVKGRVVIKLSLSDFRAPCSKLSNHFRNALLVNPFR